MGFRFRRRIKLFPGVALNVSKSGVSTSVGVPGLHETYGHGKVRTTVGLPDSGISYTTTENSALPSVSRSMSERGTAGSTSARVARHSWRVVDMPLDAERRSTASPKPNAWGKLLEFYKAAFA